MPNHTQHSKPGTYTHRTDLANKRWCGVTPNKQAKAMTRFISFKRSINTMIYQKYDMARPTHAEGMMCGLRASVRGSRNMVVVGGKSGCVYECAKGLNDGAQLFTSQL